MSKSQVTFIQPKLRIAKQLQEAGGITIAEALEEAHDNLEAMRPRALTELQMAAQNARDCFQRFPTAYAVEPLQELYSISARAVGVGVICGAPGADQALISLCRLIDTLMERRLWDLQSVAVHVQTLQLMSMGVRNRLDAAALDQILSGLRKVSARYAA
jgi:hypothetical protein